jgi:hypothetical protein
MEMYGFALVPNVNVDPPLKVTTRGVFSGAPPSLTNWLRSVSLYPRELYCGFTNVGFLSFRAVLAPVPTYVSSWWRPNFAGRNCSDKYADPSVIRDSPFDPPF